MSRNWFTPCRQYLAANQKDLQCLAVFDQVDGLGALNSLIQVLDAEILGHSHPFTGIYFKFSDPFDDFFKVGTGPTKRPSQMTAPESPEDPFAFFGNDNMESGSENDDYEHHDFTQDYEPLDAWISRQQEEALERRLETAKLDGPLKRIFAKIPSMKHVHMVVDYHTKRSFQPEKFKRFISILPLNQIQYFRTNLRISEFIDNLRPGQLPNLKTIHVDGLMNALPATLERLFAICPAVEKWESPVPGNMVASFGPKQYLIKELILYNFINTRDFTQIRVANLSLTTLIATAPKCPIGKACYDQVISLMQDNRATLQSIQMSEAFLKHVLKSNMTPITTVRRIIIGKCSKANKNKALDKFPNAIFFERTK